MLLYLCLRRRIWLMLFLEISQGSHTSMIDPIIMIDWKIMEKIS